MRLHLLRFEIPLDVDKLMDEVLKTFGFDHLDKNQVNIHDWWFLVKYTNLLDVRGGFAEGNSVD